MKRRRHHGQSATPAHQRGAVAIIVGLSLAQNFSDRFSAGITVKYINDKVIIYSDIASPPGGFTALDYQQIGDEFSTLIYPTDVSSFGTPLDRDNNGRIILLYTPDVNKLTSSGNPSSFVGGFFWAGDLFPATGAGNCRQSNMAELFYVLTPDPTGAFNGNIRNTTQVRQGTRGTIAHEFQHMINASERIRSPIEQDFEDIRQVIDTNSAWMAQQLNKVGLPRREREDTFHGLLAELQRSLSLSGQDQLACAGLI